MKAVISTNICDNEFCVDFDRFCHFCGTHFCGRGSGLDRCLREMEDWITAGQVSVEVGAEAGRDWIREKWKQVAEF